jgi:collagen type III alpha
MATVIDAPDPALKNAARVDEQIAEAADRVRGHDLALGGLLVGGLVLGYAAAVMSLDKAVNLPEWARQLSLLAFLTVTGFVAYRTLVLPLRRRVNPLYAAVLVERTIDNPKNSVVGYVEAKERADVHPTVKAAMGARAAKTVTKADVNHAVDHRGLAYAGGAVVALFLALVVLFFLFRPAQFQSLLGRAFVPFSSDPIATRTQLTLIEPQAGDVTVTAGQSVGVRVEVGGRLPKPDGPDRVRVLVRYTQATAAYDEVPLEPGDHARDWLVQLRPEQLRTGAWYKVAAGDAATPEYRVTVRTAPLFTDFEVEYDFPAYVRRPAEKSTDPHLQAIRNTKVSVVAKANRPVRDGRAAFEPPGLPGVVGKTIPGRPDALRFDFLLSQRGSYKLTFTAGDGERSPESMPFGIDLTEDTAPQVVISQPEPDDILLPANGLLSVDGAAGDDYGLDRLTLRLKLIAPEPKRLADRPYQNGKSFRRDADGTYPTSLSYKDSVDLPKLTDASGGKLDLKDGMVIEYWLEATDNRTKPGAAGPEPDPQVGRSGVKRVRLTPPVESPDQKQEQDARRDQRKQEEQKHAAEQQKKLDDEDRGPPDPKQQPEPKKNGDATPEGKKGNDPPAPMPPDMNKMPPDKGDTTPGGMSPEGKLPPESKNQDMPPPDKKGGDPNMTKQDGKVNDMGMPTASPDKKGGTDGTPPQAPMPSDPGRTELENKADRVKDQLNQEQNGGGNPKAAPTANPEERTDPANQKSNPPPDAKQPDGNEKQNDGGTGASEPRNDGAVRPPEPPSTTKAGPEPKNGKQGDPQPSEPRSDPLGGEPGMERDPSKGGMPPQAGPMDKGMPPSKDDPMNKGMGEKAGDPQGGGEPKPGTQHKADSGPMNGMNQPNPADGAGKAKTAPPSADRGRERPMGGDPKTPPDAPPPGGDPKAQVPPEPGAARPEGMKEPDPTPMGGKAGDPMGAAEPRPMPKASDQTAAPMAKNIEPGDERGTPKEAQPNGPPQQAPMPKTSQGKQPDGKGSGTKLDEKQRAELDQAAKDLTSPDPAKQADARNKLDNALGKNARQQIEDIAKDLKSDDPADRARGQQKLDDLRKQADQLAGKEPAPMTPKAGGTDMNPPDPKTPTGGMEMNPPDPKVNGGMNPKTDGKAGTAPKIDPKDLQDALNNLNNKDDAKRQEARDKLDRTVGEPARKQAEQLMDDLNSKDPDRQARAREQLEQMSRKAEQMSKQGPPEGKFDPGGGNKFDEKFGPHGGNPDPKNAPPIADDPKNRAKSAELTLDRFERNRYNRDLQDKLGWTQEDYDRFLSDYRREVERLRREANEADLAGPTPVGPMPRPVDINAGGRIDGGPGAAPGAAGVGGPSYAAPGFGDALRRFQQGATQRPPAKKP